MGLWFYCKNVRFDVQPQHGPVILACNHPNSFLDALIIGSHYKHPIHFLARGDVFAKPFVARLLRAMNMIPIHRLSEGRAGLKHNEQTFRECLRVLEAKGTLLIFSEGICKNEWVLRPLKKGTARLAYAAWQEKGLTDLIIKPISLSYSTFSRLPISVEIKEATNILCIDVPTHQPAQYYHCFNALLYDKLQSGLRTKEEMNSGRRNNAERKIALAIPAALGWLTHKPLYEFLKKFAAKKTAGTVFYHSALLGLLLIVYPVVLLIATSIAVLLTGQNIFWLLALLLPFTAWCCKEWVR